MNRIMIRQTIVVSCLVAILSILLLIHVLLILSIAGAYPTHTGIMLIASHYQID